MECLPYYQRNFSFYRRAYIHYICKKACGLNVMKRLVPEDGGKEMEDRGRRRRSYASDGRRGTEDRKTETGFRRWGRGDLDELSLRGSSKLLQRPFQGVDLESPRRWVGEQREKMGRVGGQYFVCVHPFDSSRFHSAQ